jgi:glucosyl-dolichyl phosphate glucuronosyltransferase
VNIHCSIIICTRNRESMLGRTLEAFQRVNVPEGWRVEMIVVDNGSTDATAHVVRAAGFKSMEVRHLHEPRPGKSRAQNAAIRQARGLALLFTDDDIEPAENWLECMASPLLENRCDAVGGRIHLADDLQRPWLGHQHRIWLADIHKPADPAHGLVGASMGIHRSVIDRIGGFDEELGPGASGFGEETLLWLQMIESGMRIEPVLDTHVTHYPDPSRLLRKNCLSAAACFGRTRAYIMHHWEHVSVPFPRVTAFWCACKLGIRRFISPAHSPDAEGCPEWEISYVARIETMKSLVRNSGSPRNYHRRALRRMP